VARTASRSASALVALEALKDGKTTSELAGLYQVHLSQIAAWKKRAVEGLVELFSDRRWRRELRKK